MNDDQLRQGTIGREQSPEELYSLPIEEVLEIFEEAGLPRTTRAVQRYCALGKLDCHKVETATGERYLVTPHSVERLIKYIKEVSRPGATSHEQSRLIATSHAIKIKDDSELRQPTTDNELSRPLATASDEKYVALLVQNLEFLRSEIAVKNTQISELTERNRETNVLVGNLQNLLRPLLHKPGERLDSIIDHRSETDNSQP
jgi:hypothetical protein